MTEEEVPVDLVCVREAHLRHGRNVPDGEGHLTVVDRKWAYCSAGLGDEAHSWRESGGMGFAGIRHADLDRYRENVKDGISEDPRRRA
jgi:hypothetical protein